MFRDQNPHLQKKNLVLLLERKCKPVDDGAQNFQELSHPIVTLSFVDEVVENVVNLFPNVRS